ncbi:translesion error-prone DNA polymerase V subunit UmuC (plasmid) [Citrobacter freundii]|uniref:translesion error-prone DNA polymerase V subunit UmuC n=1 Tax=Citrobacter freundii TaxID=546 RepID=UPI00174E3B11|nr:translesion error-prone DNA polymerase V subunit UmuC [Citrobacter freundii]HCP9940209.1 translesion error-prone DNA polymerase V subunit UmuC [Escherichia coli]EKW5624878.1 translesion error-prone DNA polymerase V subunit UmuC [Citrobacter freundii]MBJ9085813.1 translesion error-prone DNA polymerase V subunit UmuC [Citrobacter freundii]QMI78376.1 translesion error-prone DNA polymerase V subunit UmuC [Citrobacter freundii]UDV25171.1 translesion error-prone DNA polymerase V subunit UmuC [Cit
MFLHSDANAFYCSVEQVFRPDLTGKPVIVATNNDGAIAALNCEAKALGLKRGQPIFEVRDLIEQRNVTVFSSNYTLYADFSTRFHSIVGACVPRHEVYSVDEIFASLHGMTHLIDYQDFGRELRQSVLQQTSLTCGVGIAPTKTLCKCATAAAKKYRKTQGVVVLDDPQRRDRLLALMDVSDVWGIGKRLASRLQAVGINTALDLANADTRFIRRYLGVTVERTVRELRGEPCFALDDNPPSRQQIVVSRSFGEQIIHFEDMRQAICAFTSRAGEKLRRNKSYAGAITVFIQNSRHNPHSAYFSALRTLPLPATQDTRDLINTARKALDLIWTPGIQYTKAGVMLSDIGDGREQLDLFSENKPGKNSKALMQLMDAVNEKQRGLLFLAGEGIQRRYKMKQQWLSPCYTTQWKDLPVAWLK